VPEKADACPWLTLRSQTRRCNKAGHMCGAGGEFKSQPCHRRAVCSIFSLPWIEAQFGDPIRQSHPLGPSNSHVFHVIRAVQVAVWFPQTVHTLWKLQLFEANKHNPSPAVQLCQAAFPHRVPLLRPHGSHAVTVQPLYDGQQNFAVQVHQDGRPR
jgi:hypothetical protein